VALSGGIHVLAALPAGEKKVPVEYEGGWVPEPVRRCWRKENVELEPEQSGTADSLEESRLESEERVLSNVINLVRFKLNKNNESLWVCVAIVLE
jgi:hypothetical protein